MKRELKVRKNSSGSADPIAVSRFAPDLVVISGCCCLPGITPGVQALGSICSSHTLSHRICALMISASFSIRSSGSRDAHAVSELLRASYTVLMEPAYEPAVLGPALNLMTHANPRLLSSGTYYVAESSGGDLVGCGGWTHEPPGGGVVVSGVGHLRHFAVHPIWTRRGVGSAIYRLCEAEARAAGVQRFECQASLNALDFYAALGFRRASVIDIRMAPDVLIKGCEMYCEI